MDKPIFDQTHNGEGSLAAKVISNMGFVKSLSDVECMVWARLNDRWNGYLDPADLCEAHSQMGDPVYDKLDSLFDEDEKNVGVYADLMHLIETRKMNERIYMFILDKPKKVIRETFGRAYSNGL